MRDSLPSARYSPVCNVLRQWKTSLILTQPVLNFIAHSGELISESTDSMIIESTDSMIYI